MCASATTSSALFLAEDVVAIRLSHEFLIMNGVCYSLLALLFVFRYSLQGLGYSLVPTVAGIAELVMRSICTIALTSVIGYTGTCIATRWHGSALSPPFHRSDPDSKTDVQKSSRKRKSHISQKSQIKDLGLFLLCIFILLLLLQ